jgi:hypothetical protein
MAGADQHELYVRVSTAAEPDPAAREATLQALRYLRGARAVLAQMGIAVRVNKLRASDLQNARLHAALARRGITRLPALTTPRGTYVGFAAIRDLYERNIRAFLGAGGGARGRAADGAAGSPEGDLDRFYREEMTFARAEQDSRQGEGALGDESGEMLDGYHRMMMLRKPPAERKPSAEHEPPAERGPPAEYRPPAPGGRLDNLAREPWGPDEEAPDPQDALMEHSFWEGRMGASDAGPDEEEPGLGGADLD